MTEEWISIKDKLPDKIVHTKSQSNGNTLYFYEEYAVKGFWDNDTKSEDIRVATYMPNSICWYFNVHKSTIIFNFVITHWKPFKFK